MRVDENLHLADVLREYRERLAGARGQVESGSEQRAEITGELAQVEARMLDIESFLRDLAARTRAREARRLRTRIADLLRPRLLTLRQHDPVPLRVPTRYFATQPPDPPPTISIVTPSFEQAAFLERTLYSVVGQEYPRLEYVVQDGGSTDGTVAILKRYDRVLASWASEPDGGQANAINRGLEQTTGEIMAYLNSDDLLLPGSLAYVGGYFASHPDVDVVYGQRLIIDGGDGHIGTWMVPRHRDLAFTMFDFVPQETLFWRRRIWERVGGHLDERFDFAIDWELLLRFRDLDATFVRLPRFLGAFRVHDQQKTELNQDVCMLEGDRLRTRTHGRAVSDHEALARAQPYLRRHAALQSLHGLAARRPLRPMTEVPVLPHEPWLREDARP